MIAFDRRQPPPSIINTIKAAQIYSELRRYSLSLKTDRSKLTAAAVAAEAAGWKIFRLMKPRGRSRSQTLAGAVAAANSRPVLVICAAVFLVGAAVSVPWINNSLRSSITGSGATAVVKEAHNAMASAKNTSSEQIRSDEPLPPPQPPPSFSCPAENETDEGIICRDKPPSPPSVNDLSPPPPPSCPQYFRWIHEDLRPWRSTGITREMVERGRRTANFRLVVLGGRAYLERYRRSFQSRDVFTLWGIVQLLRRYPGRIPDLDLMFDTVDWPVINAADYRGRDAAPPPPLFRYCGDDSTLDIVFPDWSFWGRKLI
ncbi:protein glucosyltransferase [Apostasia shenzhenica]|uniref:Protein glucosyltransferase n=1 Tax=Apostasia shenzhenica TaxID=1088818 RepID=A0A2I0AEE6_9ASPA|nr:protein glucosyltransferase [Apostasia shenzhenica]